MINIIKHYKFWFLVSGILALAGVISLAIYGLNLGVDFKGGTLTQVKFEAGLPANSEIQEILNHNGFNDVIIQPAGDKSVMIRTGVQDKEQHDKMLKALSDKFGKTEEEQFTSIGPVVGKELRSQALLQLFLVSLGIIFYIAYAFRKVSKPVSSWRFGVSAIVALLHDLLIVVGAFSILGHFAGVQIDSLFVTALLTVLGFSVHDTIVVFDRIRENLRLRAGQSLSEIINSSINQTLIRSINTSLTVIFVLTALLLFGGETIRYFVLALLIGIIAGTYSSIFIASPLLLVWQNWSTRRRA
ncbi:MAG TPA: protein translocase subunit SecF [Patescibacteria group bacterium]|jgi:preprotein translocase subunit SecF|nr:protein translocase subunit SecF [Patescibacteria group bacterium]